MAELMSVVYLVFLALVLAINNKKLKTAHQSQILAMALVIYLENQNVFIPLGVRITMGHLGNWIELTREKQKS
jgi:FtsH-binding integral membrane protein